MAASYTLDQFKDTQHYDTYTDAEHGMWNRLYTNMMPILKTRACTEYLEGLDALKLSPDRMPDYRELNPRLEKLTGWQIEVIKGFIPPALFFELLSQRRFPASAWIRKPEEMDYLEEPDIFHDVFGHVPLLSNPVFADYMEVFGKGGLKAIKLDALEQIQRLYWFTVEFGLVNSDDGIKIYGSGILSSAGESKYSIDSDVPHRIAFDLERIMRTTYRIDEFQKTYFVVDSFDQLMQETAPDFTPLYERVKRLPTIHWTDIDSEDAVLHRGHPAKDDKPPMTGTDKYASQ